MTMKKTIIHLLIIVLIIDLLLGPIRMLIDSNELSKTIETFTSLPFFILYTSSIVIFTFYAFATYQIIAKYYQSGQMTKIFGSLIVAVILLISLRYLIQEVLMELFFGFSNYNEGTTFSYYIIDNLYYIIIFCGVGAVYYFYRFAEKSKLDKAELLLQNKKSELSFLKSQMNPHFLFNSMNSIYALVFQNSEKALPTIKKLSDLMRYSLYETEDLVPLSSELDYIENYIEMQNIRTGGKLNYTLDINGEIDKINIAPFILIPFVENAFKHGDLNNVDNPLTFKLNIEEGKLYFSSSNFIKKQHKDEVGGIGLTNVKKRLELIYKESFDLKINEENEIFNVVLNLNV